MNSDKSKILVVDDERDIREIVNEILSDEGYQVAVAHDADAARNEVRLSNFDAVLLDIWMPGDDGVTLLKEWRESGFDTPVIMMSGHGTVETAVEATRYGAYDYLEKPVSMGRLLVAIRNAVGSRKSAPDIGRKDAIKTRLVGSSESIKQVSRQVKKVAEFSDTVMIIGEPGTGKRFVSQLIHEHAGKNPDKLVDIDIPEGVQIDSILKTMQKLGGEGTVVFPNIHGFNSQSQLRLMSLLNRMNELSDSEEDAPLARLFVTATPGIVPAVSEAYFRADLFYRLRSTVIELPALREHPEDIPELVGYFTDLFSQKDGLPYKRISTSALNRLRNHQWTGNIQELKSVIHQALMHASNDEITMSDVAAYLVDVTVPEFQPPEATTAEQQQFDMPYREAKAQFERDYVIYNLRNCTSYKQMQEKTGLDRSNLYRKLKAHGLRHLSPGATERADK